MSKSLSSNHLRLTRRCRRQAPIHTELRISPGPWLRSRSPHRHRAIGMRARPPRLPSRFRKIRYLGKNLQLVTPIGRDRPNHQRHSVAIDQQSEFRPLFCGDLRGWGQWRHHRQTLEHELYRSRPSPGAIASSDSAWSVATDGVGPKSPPLPTFAIWCARFRHSSSSPLAHPPSGNPQSSPSPV